MKALLAALHGAALFGGAAYGLLSVFARWYGTRYTHFDADTYAVYLPMFIVQGLSVLIGAYVGFR
jgi:hypothetical protein